jgi:hypothetical protein
MTEAYQALCELWASPEYHEKSAKKRKSGRLLEHTRLGLMDTSVWVNKW